MRLNSPLRCATAAVTEKHQEVAHRRLLYWLAIGFFLACCVPLILGGLAESKTAIGIGYVASYFGVSWLAPGIFIGIARRSVWVGIGASFVLLLAIGVLVVITAEAAGIPMDEP